MTIYVYAYISIDSAYSSIFQTDVVQRGIFEVFNEKNYSILNLFLIFCMFIYIYGWCTL